jgi:tetratricopeptide (TPR) repeat protein
MFMGNDGRACARRALTAVLSLLEIRQESIVYIQPTLDAFSGSNDPTRLRAVGSLIAGSYSLKFALMLVFIVTACGVNAQTYSVGPDASKAPQAQTNKAQSPDQPLGWGSNIQNARLARAAQLALQQGNHALALDYAQRAAQAAPNDPQLWFLLGYAARLSGRYPLSVEAYDRGLHLSPAALEGISGLAQT